MGEAFGVASKGGVENLLPVLDDLPDHVVMQHLRSEQGDPAVVMLVVVPGKELLAKGTCVLDGAEPFRELGAVLEGFELAFRVRVVVRDVGPTMRFCQAQIGHQQRHRFRGHRGAAVGVDGQIAGQEALLGACFGDQSLGQLGGFAGRHHPAHHVAAEDLQDDVKVEVSPLGRAE